MEFSQAAVDKNGSNINAGPAQPKQFLRVPQLQQSFLLSNKRTRKCVRTQGKCSIQSTEYSIQITNWSGDCKFSVPDVTVLKAPTPSDPSHPHHHYSCTTPATLDAG